MRPRSIELFGFVDEHDGDIIPDFMEKPAVVANEAVARLVETNVSPHFGQARISSRSLRSANCFTPQ